MSNWGRPYFSNNQNYSSASSYHNNRPNNSNSGGHGNDSRWHYYQQQQPPQSNNSSSSQSVGGVYLPSHRQQYNGTSSTNMESDIFYPSHVRGGAPAVDFNSSLSSSSSRSGLMNNPLQFNNSGRSHLNSDIWAKAANSNLVPTAGEFFPSGNCHQPPPAVSDYQGGSRHELNNNSSTNDNQWKFGSGTGQRSDSSLSSSQYEGTPNHRGGGGNGRNYSGSHHLYNSHHQSSSNRNPSKSNYNREYHQKNNNNNGKSGWNNHSNSSNYSNRGGTRNNYSQSRSSNSSSTYGRGPTSSNSRLDDQKSEGRKKLLEEVATLLTQPQDGPCTISLSSSSSSSSTDLHSSRAGGCNSEEEELRKVINLTNIVDGSNGRSSGDYKRNYNHFRRTDRGAENFGTPPPFPSRVFNNTNMSAVTDKQLSDRTGLLNQDNTVSQRERLTEQLERGTLECLVCYDRVRQTDSVWNCSNCFHVLHLRCIIRWANSSRSENGWRCPACQNVSKLTPRNYYCFCGKVIDPDWNRGNDIPHSCGEVCNKPKPNPSPYFQCNHPCTLLCHPGPCPPCITMIHRNCGCGRTSQMIQCGQNSSTISCGETCCKGLNCGEHFCSNICHLGDCKPCPAKISQECYCGTMSREVACDKNNINIKKFECGNECPKKLECGEHPCLRNCHPGSCGPCPLDPSRVTHCPCGKMPINNVERKSCLDPVPTCSEICSKSLTCGQPGNPHMCKSACHEGNCPTCDRTTLVRCRCGHMDKEIPCKDLTTKADDARCQKKCPKKRSCGKHKCNQLCCIEVDHVCPIPCNHMLTCGQHRCEELCHRGHCKPCWRTSFEELFCECRSSVLFPPIPCGTRPPECKKPCSRQHNCDHPALHSCHSEPNCPPCTVLTAKYCHGMHELRKTVPCHLEEFSCGMPCNKELPCGHHKCILPCHKGECLKPGQLCVQPCSKTRSLCGHPCNAPCHEDECPDTPCKETVKVTCECGNRSMTRPCCENNKEYQRIATSLLASKMADVQLGRCIDLQDMQGARNKMSLKTLECNDECRIVERNRRMSIGLQIRNPDLSSKLTPRYSDFMRGWAKKDPKFCQHVHDKLSELVHLAKQSKQKSRSYSFETMNREKRQFVHEYCEHFGCESVAYDAEPKRNIVATAQRDKAWLPSYSLLEVIQREMGQRKVPLPTLNGIKKPATATGTTRAAATAPLVRLGQNHQQLSSHNSTQQQSSTQQHLNSNSNSNNKIDYFNYTNT